MSVRIQLDRPHSHFTNLDLLTGRVILNLTSTLHVSTIVVKLEGESKTRLSAPQHPEFGRQKDVTELEVHKILYRVVEVFPSTVLKNQAFASTAFTLPAGQHEYPFQFKFPINNHCSPTNSLYSNLNFVGPKIEFAKDTNKHVKKILPPSLSGFPGEAEVRYYVKVTVNRPQFYKENLRSYSPLKFFPIEPPRPDPTGEETYARRAHQFRPRDPSLVPPTRKKSLFDNLTNRRPSEPSSTAAPGPDEPPRFSVDARLPNPIAITCNEPLPLRILVHKLSACREPPVLQNIQIDLFGYTTIRAHDLHRKESSSWVIMSRSNMGMTIGDGKEPSGAELVVDDSLWKNIPLPNTVAPSFETCNIKRHYELEVRVGLGYGAPGRVGPELIVLPLRLGVLVYSGISPPAALLEAMQKARTSVMSPAVPLTPPTSGPSAAPPPASLSAGDAGGDLPDVAPPSYEDAMAQDIGPLDGRRRDYQDPLGESRVGPRTSTDSTDGRDKKDGGGGIRREGTLRLEGERRRGSGGGGGGGAQGT